MHRRACGEAGGDAVFCKVGSSYFTHRIGNNHGPVNIWTTRDKIFGKVAMVED